MLTAERLRELLHYDQATGLFTWLTTRCDRATAGEVAGSPSQGYIRIKIDRQRYAAHRLAWLWMTGKWPAGEIDHEDTNGTNNRWSNLREATRTQNEANKTRRADNTSGFKGVSWDKRSSKWHAYIRVDRRLIHLGFFTTLGAAAARADAARHEHFGKFARAA